MEKTEKVDLSTPDPGIGPSKESIVESEAAEHRADAPASHSKNRAQRYRASVSFEYDYQPVVTYRGEVSAWKPDTAARLAVLAARRAYPGRNWRSMVAVLEKLDDER